MMPLPDNEEQKYSALGRMAGVFAHEMANPLDGVNRYVDLALQSSRQDPTVQQYLREAKDGLVRMNHMIRAILNYGGDLSRDEWFGHIQDVIEESLMMFEPRLKDQHISVEKKFTHLLPLVKVGGMDLVINNLVKNACDAMPKGGVLTITTQKNGNFVEVSISDTGAGISPEQRSQIFEAFYTTKGKGQGTGLGLAIARQIIDQFHGQILVESAAGGGASFVIRLPLAFHLPEAGQKGQ